MNSLSIGSAIQAGWEKFTQNIAFFLLFIFIVVGVSFVTEMVNQWLAQWLAVEAVERVVWFIAVLALSAVNVVISIWTLRVGLDAASDRKPSFASLLPSWEVLWKFFLSSILTTLIVGIPVFIAVAPLVVMFFMTFGAALSGVGVGSFGEGLLSLLPVFLGVALVFVVVSIYFSMRLFFVGYFVVDKKLNPVESIRASWNMTKGQFWPVVGLSLVVGLINMGGALAFLIGLVVTVPLTVVALANAYLQLSGSGESVPTPFGEEVPPVPRPVPRPEN